MSNPNAHKPGYKHTPLGWIPEEWEVVRLKDIVKDAKLGGNYENSTAHTGIPVIKMGNLNRGKISIEELQYLPYACSYNESDILQGGDLLFNTRNTLDLVGKVAVWRNELPLAVYNSNILRIEFKNEKVDNNYYMNSVFNSHYGLKQLKGFATGTTSVAAIYSRDLAQFKCFIPAKKEQRRIAAILSIWDEAITKTQQLITQLQHRNKGLMRALLMGKKRLKGFVSEWNGIHLSDAFTERNETGYGNLALLSVGTMGVYPQSQSEKRDTSNVDKSKYKRICPDDIGYNTMRMWQGRSALSQLEGIVSPAYTIITPKANQSSLFYSFLFKLPSVVHKFFRNSQGLVEDTLNCKFKDFAIVTVKVPEYNEQIAIADVLIKANEEMQLHEQKLAALQQQKKGLMQKLLTGEVRVKLS